MTYEEYIYKYIIERLNEEELMEFINNEGEIVMHNKDIFHEIPAIEIYDAYRE